MFLAAVGLLGLSKGGLSGIGLLSMPMMLLVMPPAAAAGLILPVLMMQDFFGVWLYRGKWDVENLKLLVPAAAIGVGLGVILFAFLPTRLMLLMLGIITMAFALRAIIGPKAPAIKPPPLVGWVLGILSGLTSTVLHQGGPTFQMYLMPQRLPRDVFVGTTVTFFWLINLIKLPGFIVLGQITREGLIVAGLAAPFALAMTWAGAKLVSHINPDRYYIIIYWILFAVGVKLLGDGLF